MSRNDAAEAVAQMEEDAKRRPRVRLRPLRALIPFISQYPGRVLAAFLALLAATAATLAMPIAVRFMIDNGFSTEDASSIDRYFSRHAGGCHCLGSGQRHALLLCFWIGERVTADLRRRL